MCTTWNLFMLSSLWTDTLGLVALMWVSSIFWALLSMPRSLRSPIYTVPMDSRPRGLHSDMCLRGFTPHFCSPSEVISPSRNTDEKHPSKQAFEAAAVTLSSILFPGRRGTQQAVEEWELTEKQKRMSRFPPDIIKNICCIFADKREKVGTTGIFPDNYKIKWFI